MNKVMRIIKMHNVNIVNQKMELKCDFTLSIRMKKADQLEREFELLRAVKMKRLEV
ncbi:MAG TPA: hypothetical protein VJ970_00875 [Flavobacteriaceae bacterium]|nr:hypothetical protein [Flavobacteriaceae bacterium]